MNPVAACAAQVGAIDLNRPGGSVNRPYLIPWFFGRTTSAFSASTLLLAVLPFPELVLSPLAQPLPLRLLFPALALWTQLLCAWIFFPELVFPLPLPEQHQPIREKPLAPNRSGADPIAQCGC